MTYREKLKDPRWQRRRLEVMQAANWRCQHCGRGSTELHAHHALYIKDREPWEYPDKLLVCLCGDCHGEWHSAWDSLVGSLAVLMAHVPGKRVAAVFQHFASEAVKDIAA